MPLSIAPFPEQNLGPLQQALAQSQNQFSQNTAAQIANSQFAQKLDMQAQQDGREEAANAIHQAFALAAQTKMNEAKLAMERETNQTNKEINLLKLAMAQKENEATQAYRDAQLRSLTQHRETQDAIAQQNADTNAARAAKTKAPSASQLVASSASLYGIDVPVQPLTEDSGGAPQVNPTPTTGSPPNPLLPPPPADASTPPEAINKPATSTPPDATPAPEATSPPVAQSPVSAPSPLFGSLADSTLKKPDITPEPQGQPVAASGEDQVIANFRKLVDDPTQRLIKSWASSQIGDTQPSAIDAKAVELSRGNVKKAWPIKTLMERELAIKTQAEKEANIAEKAKTAALKAQKQALDDQQKLAQDKTTLELKYQSYTPEQQAIVRDVYTSAVNSDKGFSMTEVANSMDKAIADATLKTTEKRGIIKDQLKLIQDKFETDKKLLDFPDDPTDPETKRLMTQYAYELAAKKAELDALNPAKTTTAATYPAGYDISSLKNIATTAASLSTASKQPAYKTYIDKAMGK